MKLTKEEKVFEDVFNILSSNYTEEIDESGEGEFILNDEQRKNVLQELTAYVLNTKKKGGE